MVITAASTKTSRPLRHAPMLRFAGAQDEGFLRDLYRSTRESELAMLPWSEEQKTAFCDMQFAAQSRAYRNAYPEGRHFIACAPDGQAMGRLITATTGEGLLLVDISLLPAFQRRGFGTALLQSLQEKAEALRTPLRLSVDRNNRAQGLYRRLGFDIVAGSELRYQMVWHPNLTEKNDEGESHVRPLPG